MNYFIRIFTIVLFFSATASAEELKFGVASIQENLSCISFGKTYPSKKSKIGVLSSDADQVYIEGKLGDEVKTCSVLERSQIEGPYFEFIPSKKTSASFIGMAVIGQYKNNNKNGMVSLSKKGMKEKVYFRSCTSSEGLHFSGWLGIPLQGKKIWHQYLYLGYDVEPSCEEKDYQEPSA